MVNTKKLITHKFFIINTVSQYLYHALKETVHSPEHLIITFLIMVIIKYLLSSNDLCEAYLTPLES